jgi:subtilisin family serine protease
MNTIRKTAAPPRLARRWGIRIAAVAVLGALAAAGATVTGAGESAQAAPASSSSALATSQSGKVEAEVYADLAAGKGEATFFVLLAEKADLSAAATIDSRTERGQHVLDELSKTAEQSQAPLRELLTERRVAFTPYWIVNAIRVTGDRALVDELAARPDVRLVFADKEYELPEPTPATDVPRVNAIEWGIDRINAPDVWALGITGQGIVVGTIDSGVQFNHPAIVAQYRGNLGGGSFDHNYNWHDPSNICGNPSLIPCDNNGHGTHVTGTMVGDDGGANQIGVAPGARWIAAKGCETNSCSTSALLSSGQFILAPTNLAGTNPDVTKRPHIVNNSWGGGPDSDPWYQATVQAWVAAGIFPQFSNGNAGPGCGTAGNPGNTPEAYAAGAFDVNNVIASFSSRGASAFGGIIKPNISAPGVAVRSSVPSNTYASFNGTSMASPHVAGAIALLWDAAPTLVGDIAATRSLLDGTAIDVNDTTCGGTAANNNVWGQGRLDVLAAYNSAPVGPSGTLTGTVTASGGGPIAGATVVATGPITRSGTTNASGVYSFVIPVGSYTIEASAFGYVTQSTSGTITEGGTTTRNFTLSLAPGGMLSGTVRDAYGRRVAGTRIEVLGTPLSATTDGFGQYSFSHLPNGTHTVRQTPDGCRLGWEDDVTVAGSNVTRNFSLASKTDTFGYSCWVLPSVPFEEAGTVLPVSGDDVNVEVPLPIPFTFYGSAVTVMRICTNGIITFTTSTACPFTNTALPNAALPNLAIYPYWDDLIVDASASVRGELKGMAPNRRYVIEFRNVRYFSPSGPRVGFNVVLYENGMFMLQYRDIANDGREQGNSATIGIENGTGTDAFEYSFNEAVLSNGMSIMFKPPGMPTNLVPVDFNASGASNFALFRPATRQWLVSGLGTVTWGLAGDVTAPGDYNGNGATERAVFRPSNGSWWVHTIGSGGWGLPNDTPVPGDYNGDGVTDRAVFRPSNNTWWIQGVGVFNWGMAGDIPVPADYNGDGKTDIAVFRPSTNQWWIRGIGTRTWGSPGDVPVPGDYNGDGIADLATFRPSDRSWWVAGVGVRNFGLAGDVPAPADYIGDKATDIAVYRPSNGTFFVRGGGAPVALGTSTDRVVALPDAVRRVYYP